jgi:hypothetical protein
MNKKKDWTKGRKNINQTHWFRRCVGEFVSQTDVSMKYL